MVYRPAHGRIPPETYKYLMQIQFEITYGKC